MRRATTLFTKGHAMMPLVLLLVLILPLPLYNMMHSKGHGVLGVCT